MIAEVDVIAEPRRARALLHPTRLAIVQGLEQPASASALARRLGPSRQKLNYHLRELEDHGLIELVEEKRRGSCTERVYRRSGERYALSNDALGDLASRPELVRDRFSSAYQIAVASRAVRDVARLREGAAAANKKLPTFTLEAEVRFANAERRAAFTEELAQAVAKLVEKYHDEQAKGGRKFRFFLGAYPKPKED